MEVGPEEGSSEGKTETGMTTGCELGVDVEMLWAPQVGVTVGFMDGAEDWRRTKRLLVFAPAVESEDVWFLLLLDVTRKAAIETSATTNNKAELKEKTLLVRAFQHPFVGVGRTSSSGRPVDVFPSTATDTDSSPIGGTTNEFLWMFIVLLVETVVESCNTFKRKLNFC
jgi:hypothetical protein